MSESERRTILNYPFLGQPAAPGRCCHVVTRLVRVEPCYRKATHAVAGVGLCPVHYGHFEFWRRGGHVATAAEMFAHLVAEGATAAPFIDARSRRQTGEALRVPAGWALRVRRGARTGYAGLARHRAADGFSWRYRLEYPYDARRRAAYRHVDEAEEIVLDLLDDGALIEPGAVEGGDE